MGAQHLILLLMAAGCAAAPQQPDTVLGQPAPRLTAPAAPEPARPAEATSSRTPEETEAQWEQRLRHELVTGQDPAAAALELATWLAKGERYDDAMAVVAAARERKTSDPDLQRLQAALLRDLGRRFEAAAVLAELCGNTPAKDISPELLLGRVRLEWLCAFDSGQVDNAVRKQHLAAARELLRSLQQAHAGDSWLTENSARIEAVASALARGISPPLGPLDAFGDLRGSPDPERRMYVLGLLCEQGGETRARATAIAGVDKHPSLRAAAVTYTEVDAQALPDVCARALHDADAQVRRAGARRAATLKAAEAAAMLVPALCAESDPEAFTAMHEELSRHVPGGPSLPFGGAADAEVRRTVATAWQKQWAQ
jgi:hypothetical protein